MKAIIVLAALVALATANFTNYKVYRVIASDKNQLDLVRNFENEKGIDFWSKARSANSDLDIMVSPEMQPQFLNVLQSHKIQHSELISNVETVVRREQLENFLAPRVKKGKINFEQYHKYSVIVDYLNQLEADHSDIVTVSSIGTSFEGRDIAMIKISTGGNNKPAILIDGTIHAREWIAPATLLYFINELVENQDNHHMIENVDWYIIPVLNPDGYDYTHSSTSNRFWRKTTTRGKSCDGVDGNRNFDFHWMEVGASSNECSETYAGPKPFSESETRALKSVVEELGSDHVKLYLTFHSYGNYLLYPWGYTSALPDDWKTLDALAQDVAAAIYAVDRTRYTIGSSTNVLYAAAGGSDDWVKAIGGVDLSYTIELPGGGWNGFDPPASAIKGIATETWEGLKVYHAYIEKNF